MLKSWAIILMSMLLPLGLWGQCTTTDATACQCENAQQSNCDLLPDISISDWAVLNYGGGPTEYPQTGAGVNNGRLRVTGSTPNYGVGPFTIGAESIWTCGTDTFYDYQVAEQFCSYPKQLIRQRIYHKQGATMSSWERWAGSMTYHPGHGHMHVDDWSTFTLRLPIPGESNPLNWPIVGDGAKIGFCLMDFGTCDDFLGHCRDASGGILQNADFVNWGLGGGQYTCSPTIQGISVGHTDVYSENLEGMWIEIPPTTCNGDYWIVMEVDPENYFLESDETNNWAAVPITLTQQQPVGSNIAEIQPNGPTHICSGESVTLKANTGTAYQWSTGDSTQTIDITQSGVYTVTVTGPCGVGVSDPIAVTVAETDSAPQTGDDFACEPSSLTLTAQGNGDFYWYNSPVGGILVGTGPTFNTPTLYASRDYYVEREEFIPGATLQGGAADSSIGTGQYDPDNDAFLEFDALQPFTLESVLVYANTSGTRTIRITDANGFLRASSTLFIPAGEHRVSLNFQVPKMNDLRLGLDPNSTGSLFRNLTGTNYPYTVGNVATIVNSSEGQIFYPYFFDWVVKTPDFTCLTPRAKVTGHISQAISPTISGMNPVHSTFELPVALTGSPTGGQFSGPGINGNFFDPSLAGVGGPYTITYTYTDSIGCISSVQQTVTVNAVVGLEEENLVKQMLIAPNPSRGMFDVSLELEKPSLIGLKIRDLSGRTLWIEEPVIRRGTFRKTVDIQDLSPGVYLMETAVDGARYFQKIIYQ